VSADEASHLVRLFPAGVDFEVAEGEAVMRAAQRHGIFWPNTCDGNVDCGSCWAEIIDGMANLAEPSRQERTVLDGGAKAGRDDVRLACCLRITGPVTLHKRSAKPTPP
jgi:ferredoxin, 2Fe-2S